MRREQSNVSNLYFKATRMILLAEIVACQQPNPCTEQEHLNLLRSTQLPYVCAPNSESPTKKKTLKIGKNSIRPSMAIQWLGQP